MEVKAPELFHWIFIPHLVKRAFSLQAVPILKEFL